MKDSETLFQLIQSLSGPEKRYFKLISSKYEGNKNYLKVFDILSKQKNYNEINLRKKIKDKSVLKQLPRVKNYLYEMILKSISSYHADNSERSRLNNQVEQISLLISKGLFNHSNKLISKAKKRACYTGNYSSLIEILRLERGIFLMKLEPQKVRQIDLEIDEAWNHLQVNRSYSKLQGELFVITSKVQRARTSEIVQEARKIIEHPLLIDEKKAINYNSRLIYHLIHSHYAQLLGDVKSSYQHVKSMLKLIESEPFRLIEDQSNYISIINNLMGYVIELKKYDEMGLLLEKLKTIQPRNINNEIRKFTHYYTTEQHFYLKTGEFEKGVLLEKKIKEGMEIYKDNIPVTIQYIFLSNNSFLHFGESNYSKSLQFLNKAIDIMDTGQVDHGELKIFNLILHYELGHEDLLPYLLRSTYRYLLKQQSVYQYENHILQFIRKLPKIPSSRKTNAAFIELRSVLKNLEKDPFEKHAFGNFDIISWLESKIEKRKFSDVVREKIK